MDAPTDPPRTEPENGNGAAVDPAAAAPPNLDNPNVVLSLLEADQVVAVKRSTRLGSRRLSTGLRVLFWALRIYVVAMLIIVAISVFQAMHAPS